MAQGWAVLTALVFIAAGSVSAQEHADNKKEEWSIDTANPEGTPTLQVDFDTQEGTWMSVDVSPDGQTVIFDLLGHIYEMPIEGGNARRLTDGRSWNQMPRYSPDGSEIAFTSDRDGVDNIWIMNRASGELENLTKSKDPVLRGNWSADGRHILAVRFPKELTLHGEIYNRFGKKQELVESAVFRFANHFIDDAERGYFYYEHINGRLPGDGARIYRFNKKTGQTEILIQRAGGAFNPQLSPDGRHLAYMGREDLVRALYVRDLETNQDRLVLEGLDRDQMENLSQYGSSAGMSWANNTDIVLSDKGGFKRVNMETGSVSDIPFRAAVSREVNRTVRTTNPIKSGRQQTRIQRFAAPAAGGILSEALGDLYLHSGGTSRNITNSAELETNPLYHAPSGMLYYATWSDTDFGTIKRRPLAGGSAETLTDLPTQYGALALSPDGSKLAFLRGPGSLKNGGRIENQTSFDLMVRDQNGTTWKVTDVGAQWSNGNTPEIRRASPLVFSKDGRKIYFSEFADDGLKLKSIGIDGEGERDLYHFPWSTRAVISPDMKWIAFREYQRAFVTPFEFVGKTIKISGENKMGFTKRIDTAEGVYLGWSDDSTSLYWTRGTDFYRKSLEDVLAQEGGNASVSNIAVSYDVAVPDSTIAITNARIITMDDDRRVLENTSILIENNRISAIGQNINIPRGAQVFDASGQTIMPGIVDAHGHYGGNVQSYLHTIEESVSGLLSPLAHGVTTLYEVYGTAEKDAWIRDRLEAGLTYGPRLFTVGTPIFGAKYRKGLMRPIDSLEEARQALSYNQAFGAEAVKDYTQFTRRARHATVAASRELGLHDVAETAANLQMNLTQVIDGITGLEHSMGMTPLYSDVVRFMAATDVSITPTLIVVYNGPAGEQYFHHNERVWENPKLLKFQTRDELLRVRRPTFYWDDEHYAPKMAAALKPLYEAGISLQLGAHGQMSGLDAHWEMELFQQGGFTPEQIIEISTINGARYHGFGDEIGSLEVGKYADLLVLSENPLDDIRNARAITWVMQNGVLYKGEDASRVFPNPAPTPPMYFQEN